MLAPCAKKINHYREYDSNIAYIQYKNPPPTCVDVK